MMRIAKDGKPFDVDSLGGVMEEPKCCSFCGNTYITFPSRELKEGELEVIQFLRPNGKRRRMSVDVGKDYVEMAKDMIISAEELTTRKIALYARYKNEPEGKEFSEIAINGPGEKSPNECLKRLIKRKAEVRGERWQNMQS